MSSSSDEDDPNRVVPKRRIRHINTVLVHNLTLTPHRDELLSSDVPADDGPSFGSVGRRRAGSTVDDLELLGAVSGRRRRRVSTSSFQSVKESVSPPPGSPTSPSTSLNSSLPQQQPSTSGGSPTIRRPSLSRARASSRLSSYNIPSFDSSGSVQFSPSSSLLPSGSRARSSSRVSIGSAGSEFNIARQAGGLGDVAIREDAEQELPSESVGVGLGVTLDFGEESSPMEAAKRLLESFITLRLPDETTDSWRAEAGPSSPYSLSLLRLVPSSSDKKGKGRALSTPPTPCSPPSSGSSSRPSNSTSAPATPITSPSSSRIPSPSKLNDLPDSSKPSLPSRISSSSTPTVRARTTSSSSSYTKPSTPQPSSSSTLRAASSTKPRPRPNTIHDPSSSPRPYLSRSATTSLRIPSPSRPPSPPSRNPERTPFYISPIHQPSTHPRFGDLDPESDFGKWGRRGWREEKVMVEIWVTQAGLNSHTGEEKGKEKEWKVLKDVEIDLGRLKRWNGKSFLPPNTLLLSFTDHPLDFSYIPSPPHSSSPARPTLERNSSDGELEISRSSSPVVRRKLTEWGDVDDAVERSLRETTMRKGIGFGELHRLVNLQTVLQDTEESSRKIEAGLDRLIEEDEGSVLMRLISEEEARIRGVEGAVKELQVETRSTQQRIADLKSDLLRRKGNLKRGGLFLSKERDDVQEMERSLKVQKSTRHALSPHVHAQRARLSEALEAIFHITPTIHGRSLLFSINYVALPIPTHPKEPAPPLHLPASELPPNMTIDEDSVATALGYAAMVVQHLAGFMGKILPYPIISSQSRSLLRDPISVLHGPTRLFPLYSRGVEKYRFEYAVYLLNKDIEVLMIDRAIRIMDLRHTLPNLMNLLLTVSSEYPAHLPIEPRSRHTSSSDPASSSPILTVTTTALPDTSEDEENDPDRGGQTPKASEPASASALSIFWGLGGGTKTSSAAVEKKDVSSGGDGESKKPRSRRGTIARAFGGAGKEVVKEVGTGAAGAGGGRSPVLGGSPRAG